MRARPETDGGPAHADFADLYGATPEIIVNARTYRLMAVEVLVPGQPTWQPAPKARPSSRRPWSRVPASYRNPGPPSGPGAR